MTLKQQILQETFGEDYIESRNKKFFVKLIEGFSKDFDIYKEDTYNLYTDIFGEEYKIFFEEIQNNIEVLTEEINVNKEVFLEDEFLKNLLKKKDDYDYNAERTKEYEAMAASKQKYNNDMAKAIRQKVEDAKQNPKTISGTKVGEDGKAYKFVVGDTPAPASNLSVPKAESPVKVSDLSAPKAKINSTAVKTAGSAGFLSRVFDSVKKWVSGLSSKFPKLSEFIGKGISWITANPMAVIGVAGGSLLLAKIISTLKKKGDVKKAAKLQAALDASKKEEKK